jgi:hypothetical protein
MKPTFTPLHRRGFLLGALATGVATLAGMLDLPAAAHAAGTAGTGKAAANLGPLITIPQTYNNCGPAAIAEVLAYWGIARTQAQTQAALRVDGPVIGMTPYGVPAYAAGLGLRALMGVGGTDRLLKTLIAQRLPVIVHDVVSLDDSTGHWRPVEAYDDTRGIFVTSDPLLGAGYQIAYGTFDRLWAARDYAFIVLYPAARQAALSAMLTAAGWNREAAFRHNLALLAADQLDASPASAPALRAGAYRALAMAWDEMQLGNRTAARAYLRQAVGAGANPVEVRWISQAIG